ncbi:DUF5132 domain-containing protein [Candidatus Methylocalor cossyra]|uniref:DUF5132 domain-containing protein n=1 Tax=Candidatus Methylocalor cossyra TaxID=3108543 RepID=A0ABP1CBQ7_9GAMM
MAGFEDFIKNDITKGVAIGLGVAAAGVLLAPALRPAVRAAVKGGIVLFEVGREWIAEASESFDDLLAEVRAELAEQRFGAESAGETVGEAAQAPTSAETHG